jgi:hypothetical protein
MSAVCEAEKDCEAGWPERLREEIGKNDQI